MSLVVSIPSRTNVIGLAALMVNLQPQLDNDDLIYIADNSDDHSVRKVAEMYGTSRCITMVEGEKFNLHDSWNHGLELCVEKKMDGVLTINDDVLFSMTFINNLKRAHRMTDHVALCPTTPDRTYNSRVMDPNFVYFNKSTQIKDIVDTEWMPGFNFYLKRETIEKVGYFDPDYHIWYGDTDFEDRLKEVGKIGRLTNEFAWHAGNVSYQYQKPEIQKIIDGDRLTYEQKSRARSESKAKTN